MNFNWSDILIVGDSFCSDRNQETDWPYIVSKSLTNEDKFARGIGGEACSFWFTRKFLLNEIDIHIPKVLIVCHTSMERIPNDENWGINSGVLFHNHLAFNAYTDRNKKDRNDIIGAAREYYKHLISYNFHEWVLSKWFDELDQICTKYKIPIVIHINCFHPHIFNYGTTNEGLWKDISQPYRSIKEHRNHFTTEENIKIGNNLVKAIINYNKDDRLKNLRLLS
jgi:hypothetical protein